jgi:hypothetical protein
MSRRTRASRQRVVQAVALSLSVLGVIYGLLVHPQQAELRESRREMADLALEADRARGATLMAEMARMDMNAASNKLALIESSMASGDVYLWTVKAFEKYQRMHDIRFNAIDRPEIVKTGSLPAVPYQTARVVVSGHATYHQFGRFLADFENAYPFARLEDLELTAPLFNRTHDEESERLQFILRVALLIKPLPPES